MTVSEVPKEPCLARRGVRGAAIESDRSSFSPNRHSDMTLPVTCAIEKPLHDHDVQSMIRFVSHPWK